MSKHTRCRHPVPTKESPHLSPAHKTSELFFRWTALNYFFTSDARVGHPMVLNAIAACPPNPRLTDIGLHISTQHEAPKTGGVDSRTRRRCLKGESMCMKYCSTFDLSAVAIGLLGRRFGTDLFWIERCELASFRPRAVSAEDARALSTASSCGGLVGRLYIPPAPCRETGASPKAGVYVGAFARRQYLVALMKPLETNGLSSQTSS
jgi:hypothetical protein